MKRSIKYSTLTVLFMTVFALGLQAYDTTGYTSITGNQNITATSSLNKFLVPAGQSWTGGINVNNGVNLSLIIEGTATLGWITINRNNSSLYVIIGSAGSVNFQTLTNVSVNDFTVENYSNTLAVSQVNNGKLINYGTILSSSGLDINSGTSIENNGTVSVTGSLGVNSTSSLINKGTIAVNGNLNSNSKSILDNYCKITVTSDFSINSSNTAVMRSGSFLKVNGTCYFYDALTLEANSFIKTMNITHWSAEIAGPSSGHALIQYFGTLTGSKYNTYASKNIFLVDGYGNLYGTSTPVDFSIASSSCNEGFSLIGDKDGDGIPDDEDEFPEDAERAFTANYLGETTWKTLMFEDLWPNKGDYDFNDLVIKYKFTFHLNAQSEYVGLESQFQIAACGAKYANGFGFQLNIPNASVTNVTGYVHSGSSIVLNTNKTEQGSSDEAVIIVYDDINASFGSMVNVTRTGTTKTVDPITVYVSLNKLAPTTSFIINPFIYVNQDRGREVHLMNTVPTSKANPAYFGTGDDNSNDGIYYRSVNGYPWALNVTQDVDHMLETIDFCIGYPQFKEWAESGGALYDTWYSDGLYDPALY